MLIFIPLMCLIGLGAVLLRRSARADPVGQAARDDVPARLLRWEAGLLSARRAEWGKAMLGELGHIDGRGRRWRFAVGCAGAAVLLPPWGRAATAMSAVAAVAVGTAILYASLAARYQLGAGDYALAAIALVLLAGRTLAASVLLQRTGVALPGLLGGLLAALAWLALSGFTFYGVLAPIAAPWAAMVLLIAMPLLVGAAGALWGGSAVAGQRIARLAAVSAGLGLYLYATLAVAVLGAGGPPDGSGWTASYIVGDRLGSNTIRDLWFIPLTTAAIGWAAATATARLSPRLAASVAASMAASMVPAPLAAAMPPDVRDGNPLPAPGHADRVRGWRWTARLLLLCAAVAAIVILAAAIWIKG